MKVTTILAWCYNNKRTVETATETEETLQLLDLCSCPVDEVMD